MDWNTMTNEQRLAFCDEHEVHGIRTSKPWDQLSPTTQLILKAEGITTKAIYEA